MRILFTTNRLSIGGAETHLIGLAKALTQRGHTVTVISAGGSLMPHLTASGIRHLTLPLDRKNPGAILRSLCGLWRELRSHSYEAVHAHARIPAVLLRLLQPFLSFRLVTTAHLDFPRQGLGRLSVWGERTLAVSQDIKQHLIEVYGLPPDRIAVTVNGIDTDHFSPARKRKEGYRIVHVSRLDSDRSRTAFLLISLFKQLSAIFPSVSVTIIGAGNCFRRLQRAAHLADPTGKRLRLCGALDDPVSELQRADLFIGVSRAALEAMSCGLPVILSGDQGYLGLLTEKSLPTAGETNLCCRGEALPDRERLLSDIHAFFMLPKNEKYRLSRLSRDTVLTQYPFERTVRDCLTLYRSLPPRPTRRNGGVLLIGYFGCGNCGDEAILSVELAAWQTQHPDSRLTVLSGSPAETAATYGVRSVHRFSPVAVALALLTCRTIVFGGGGLLQDSTSLRSIFYYTLLLRLATVLGKDIRIAPAGIGPLTHRKAQAMTRKSLAPFESIPVRDAASITCLQHIGYRGTPVLSSDPATRLPSADPERIAYLRRHLGLTTAYFVLALRPLPTENPAFFASLLAACRDISQHWDMKVLLIPMHRQLDTTICEIFAHALPHAVVADTLSPGEVLGLIGQSRWLIGMRLHALIFSRITKTPYFAIGCDPKILAFAAQEENSSCSPVHPRIGDDLHQTAKGLFSQERMAG